MEEYSQPNSWNNLTDYSARIKYKTALGSVIEAGFEVFLKKPIVTLSCGLGFHFINYYAKSYTVNNTELALDKLPTDFNLRGLEGSGDGLNLAIKYLF